MTDAQTTELIGVMRELIAALNHSAAIDAAESASHEPMDSAAKSQFAHSAARWNEQMAQASVDKTNSFLERQADRWHLTFQQLKTATE